MSISHFLNLLKDQPKGYLFNPWYERDECHDGTTDAPEIRRRQLEIYLRERREKARYLFIAEAVGYQGGHFTGIAMTSERILLGHQKETYGVDASHVFQGLSPSRTSRTDINGKGMTEPTATIMWGSLMKEGIDPYEIVLWNAVPWHPYNPKKGLLSNRTPTRGELNAGLALLEPFLELFPAAQPVAVGRKCEELLAVLGKQHIPVRHPANGGAPLFRKQMKSLFTPQV